MPGMTAGQANRQSKLKAIRAARRASGIVEIHHQQHREKAKALADWHKSNPIDVPHGTARFKARARIHWETVKSARANGERKNWREYLPMCGGPH